MKRALAVGALILTAATAAPRAHEIPNEVTVRTLLKPEGRQLIFLVRVPLKAMRDVEIPRRERDYLDLERVDRALRDAATLWIADFVKLYEEDQQLPYPQVTAARVSLPADRSFDSYEQAFAHITTAPKLSNDIDLYWEEGLLDVAFAFPIESDRSLFAISPGLTRLGLRVNVVLRFLPPGGAERAFDVHGDPGIVRLDPRWHHVAYRFVEDGFFHILDGIDHLLFLLCLVIPFRRFRPLIIVVTSFTLAHSVTLIASAYNIAPNALWFPPLVETLIAMSIVYMALENVAAPQLERRWLITFGFGLVHGFGFSFALRENLQFAGSHLLTSLVAFNVGVELGQLLVLAVLVPALYVLFTYVVQERMGTIILSALVAHTGWHWFTERGGQLRQYRFEPPAFDLLFLAAALRWLMVAVIVAALMWLVSLMRRPLERSSEGRNTKIRGSEG